MSRPAGSSAQWHAPASDRDFVVANSLCGERLLGALEVTSDEEKASRDGRCPSCDEVLATKQRELLAGRAR